VINSIVYKYNINIADIRIDVRQFHAVPLTTIVSIKIKFFVKARSRTSCNISLSGTNQHRLLNGINFATIRLLV
jgi:hypothetical protein